VCQLNLLISMGNQDAKQLRLEFVRSQNLKLARSAIWHECETHGRATNDSILHNLRSVMLT